MASGVIGDPGGLAAPSDVQDAGLFEWSQVTGIQPDNPLVGGPVAGISDMPYDVNADRGRVVTLPAGQGDGGAPPTAPSHFDDWRDLFDWRNSPAPYVLLFALAAIGLIALRVDARGGPARASVRVGD